MSYNYFLNNGEISLVGWHKQAQETFLMLGHDAEIKNELKENLHHNITYLFDRINDISYINEVVFLKRMAVNSFGITFSETVYKHLLDDIISDRANSARSHYVDTHPALMRSDPFQVGAFSVNNVGEIHEDKPRVKTFKCPATSAKDCGGQNI